MKLDNDVPAPKPPGGGAPKAPAGGMPELKMPAPPK